MRRTRREVATAHHEAGHAVAGWHLDLPVHRVSIVPNEDSLGRVLRGKRLASLAAKAQLGSLSRADRCYVQDSLVAGAAGPEAARRYTGRYSHVGAHGDYKTFADIATGVLGYEDDVFSSFSRFVRGYARQLVDVHWDEIASVAAALVEMRELSGTALRDVLAQTLG